jgi:chemotaxis protein histidine kinase CheA
MPSDAERHENLRFGIAASLGRLRGDVIPLPISHAGVQAERNLSEVQSVALASMDDPLRADPEMKTSTSSGEDGIGDTIGSSAGNSGQPDLLSSLEMPKLMPPLTEEERLARGRQRTRRRMAIVATLAAIVVVGGTISLWQGGASDQVPLITADQSPEKVKPAEEGGLEVPNQDIAVLEDPAAEADQAAETVMPAAEQPMAETASPSEPTDVTEEQTAATEALSGQEATQPTEELTLAAPAVPESPALSAPAPEDGAEAPASTQESELVAPAVPEMPAVPSIPAVSGQQTEAPANAATAVEPVAVQATDAASAAMSTQVASASSPDATEAAPAAQSEQPAASVVQASPGGKVRVQLAALKSEAGAQAHWSKLQSKYPSLLAGLELTVEKVDKGTAGVFYRVQAGPLADRATGKKLCAELKQQNQDCLVVQ